MSFVNSICTIQGGRHVDNIADMVAKGLEKSVKSKMKAGAACKPHQIKAHLMIFVNCLIENPSFDSQTKEKLTTTKGKFGSKVTFDDKVRGSVVRGSSG